MSNGGTETGSGKKHYVTEMKETIESQSEEIARLRAQLSGSAAVAESVGSPGVVVDVQANNGYDEATDPLSFIDDEVDQVFLVGTVFTLPGWTQRAHRGLRKGEDVASSIKAAGQRKWVKNPFKATGTFRQVKDLRTLTARHWYFVIDRGMADYIFSFEKNPMPTRAIIAPEDFSHVNPSTGQPDGKKSPCSTDKLRELIRYWLQTNPGSLWIDKAYFMDDDRLDENKPNPYGTVYSMYGGDLRPGDRDIITDL